MQNWLSRCNRVVVACVWCGVELDPPWCLLETWRQRLNFLCGVRSGRGRPSGGSGAQSVWEQRTRIQPQAAWPVPR